MKIKYDITFSAQECPQHGGYGVHVCILNQQTDHTTHIELHVTTPEKPVDDHDALRQILAAVCESV